MGRRVRKFDGAFGPEGCGGGFAASFIKKGRGFAAGCVEGLCIASLRGRRPFGPRVVVSPYRAQIIKKPAPIPVISTEAERSGEISRLNSPGSMEAGDLSTQSIIKAFSSAPYRHAAPLEITIVTSGPSRHFRRGQMTKTLPPSPSFRPKRSGVEKSHSTMVHEAMRQEISRLRASWERLPSVSHIGTQPRSR